MRQIIPFKKELLFKTKISEITSISLEHTLSLRKSDLIAGEFHISGDYKMTEASINREQFYFTLPFEINLDASYDEDTINIDIDNFYYEVVNDDSLQVNIDVFVDGDKIEVIDKDEVKLEEDVSEEKERMLDDNLDRQVEVKELDEEPFFDIVNDDEVDAINKIDNLDRKDLDEVEIENKVEVDNNYQIEPDNTINYKEIVSDNINKDISYNVDSNINLNNNVNNNMEDDIKKNNFNLFDTNMFDNDTYVTYYVYVVKEEDNIDKILEKFSVTKEELANYNDLENVKMGTKLIIPSKNE